MDWWKYRQSQTTTNIVVYEPCYAYDDSVYDLHPIIFFAVDCFVSDGLRRLDHMDRTEVGRKTSYVDQFRSYIIFPYINVCFFTYRISEK